MTTKSNADAAGEPTNEELKAQLREAQNRAENAERAASASGRVIDVPHEGFRDFMQRLGSTTVLAAGMVIGAVLSAGGYALYNNRKNRSAVGHTTTDMPDMQDAS